jgi:exodeoxyribonuclease V beta subunit
LALANGHCTTSELLLLTFGRNAAAEIRHRVRERLTSALSALLEHPDPVTFPDDPVQSELVRVQGAERQERIQRLAAAVTEFDLATIGTIHGFAQRALKASGSHGGLDRGMRLLDDAGERIPELAADQITTVALGARAGELTIGNLASVTTTLKAVSSVPGIAVRPDVAAGDIAKSTLGVQPWDLLRTELVKAALTEMSSARSHGSSMSFDDLLSTVAAALEDPDSAVSGHLRRQYRVALIDEFQDTDPSQWTILRSLFPVDGDEALVVVGDPKQAIYSFRGASISTYRSAVEDSPAKPLRLGTNFRSTADALEGVANLLNGAEFGDTSIAFSEVASPIASHLRHFTRGTKREPGLRIRSLFVSDHVNKGAMLMPPARERVIDDMAEQIVESLETGLLHDIPPRSVETQESGQPATAVSRRVRPDDIAVLVRTGAEATQALEALRRRGVPAVLSRSGSVLLSPAAQQWCWLLDAMVRPADGRRVRGFALSWFGGASPSGIVNWTDHQQDVVAKQLNEWSATLAASGPEAFVRRVMHESEVVEVALRRHDGDRAYTDLLHVSEILTMDPMATNPTALLDLLSEEQPREEYEADRDSDMAARRVESDELAVQIMTIWVAKGLEFPLVYCPTLFAKGMANNAFDDPDTGERTHWYSKSGSKVHLVRKALAEADQAAERLRLLYVALTRAAFQTTVWWAPTSGAAKSPLGRVLFGTRTEGRLEPALHASSIETPALHAQTEALKESVGRLDNIDVSACPPQMLVDPPCWTPDAVGAEEGEMAVLSVSKLARDPDRSRNRWSFTAIADRDQSPANPFDESGGDTGADDELIPPDEALPVAPESSQESGVVSDLANLPAGAAFGTLAHRVLELVDFRSESLELDLAEQLSAAQLYRRVGLDFTTPEGERVDGARLFVSGLAQVITTPLGGLFDNVTLHDISAADRLDELTFDLRLGGPAGSSTLTDAARTLLRHLESDDPFLEWTRRLADGLFNVNLSGMLTGSIDLVARVRFEGSAPDRFVVVDYKSNRLHLRGGVPQPGDYAEPNMVEAMEQHNYPLQALLYQVALHRYLRARVDGYDPSLHLGGASYLFLRGMAGPESAACDGVMSWEWPVAAIEEISDVLAGRQP